MYSTTQTLTSPLFEQTAHRLKALAHPVRLAIIDLLKEGNKMNVTQIYMTLRLEQAVASQHLIILKEKNILASNRQGKHSYYYLKHACFADVVNMLMTSAEA